MLVFIDESGDPGFKIEEGSSQLFVAAMVIIEDKASAQAIESRIQACQEKLRAYPEFKFNKCHNNVRDGFFRSVGGMRFSVRAIVVNKYLIYSDNLKNNKETFYNYFLRQMLKHDNENLRKAKIIIDGSGDRAFRKELKKYLRKNLGGRVRDVRFGNSENDYLLQLADMSAGAIARAHRTDRRKATRWYEKLQQHIEDDWQFR